MKIALIATARGYHEDILRQRRSAFYQAVKNRTAPGGEV